MHLNRSCVLKVILGKCYHIPAPIHRVCSVNGSLTTGELFKREHGGETEEFRAWTNDSGQDFEIEKTLTIQQINDLFPRFNNLSYQCPEIEPEPTCSREDEPISAPKRNAFDVLVQNSNKNKRILPRPKSQLSNRKDELYNKVVEMFREEEINFPSTDEAHYCVSVISNALWYVTNHHETINNAQKHHPSIICIPAAFKELDGYNETKRKKVKSVQLKSSDLHSHAQALYSLLLRPGKSTKMWKSIASNIKQLADSLTSYEEYLVEKTKSITSVHKSMVPARQLSEDADIRHVPPTDFVDSRYDLIIQAVIENGLGTPVIFDENQHLLTPFENNMQRFRYFDDMHLSIPVDVIRFCPGGSFVTITCISQVRMNRESSEILNDGATMLARVRPKLKEFHTRAQRNEFKQKIKNVAKINSTLLDIIYKELALDASFANHPDTETRINAMLLGATGLVADLRSLNSGRPDGSFDVFFEKMSEHLNEITSCDDRRHGSAHMSQWLSIQDLIDQVAAKCPADTRIPSKTLLRLQFTPSNPYTRAALSFTSRFPLQHKIQRRQLRAKHPDDHYCAAQYKYLRCRAVEEGNNALFFSCDDKSKIHVGEPGAPVSTGVRGKTSITTKDTTLEALDHDLYKSSLTPNVVLKIETPETSDKSFVKGQVYFTVSDSIFQSSSPFRHGAMLVKIFVTLSQKPSTLLKYTDGGTDQRNNLESVRIATICIFKHLNLDMVVTGRCAPGHSFSNPAERIMSILNLGLQNVATERSVGSDEFEKKIKSCNSMQEIREADKKSDSDIIKKEWEKSIRSVQQVVCDRFSRLNLKEDFFESIPTVTDQEIDQLKQYIVRLFPGLDPNKLQKQHTSRVPEYNEWKRIHCRETHYTFQVRKCLNTECCSPPSRPIEMLRWLPTPVLSPDANHYKPYDEVRETEITSDDHRPSLKEKEKKKNPSANKGAASSSNKETEFSLSSQTARSVVACVECQKPRVVYCKTKLDFRHMVILARNISSFEYSCGSELFPPEEKRKLAKAMTLRPGLTCADQIEVPYYGESNVGRKDLCSHCGSNNSAKSEEMIKKFKTVLPICKTCTEKGKEPFTQRPYGKK